MWRLRGGIVPKNPLYPMLSAESASLTTKDGLRLRALEAELPARKQHMASGRHYLQCTSWGKSCNVLEAVTDVL